MNWLEQFAITIVLGVLNQVIKDPALKAQLQTQLIGIASDIAATYGYTLTAPGGAVAQVKRIG
jgi:hypothetical protein